MVPPALDAAAKEASLITISMIHFMYIQTQWSSHLMDPAELRLPIKNSTGIATIYKEVITEKYLPQTMRITLANDLVKWSMSC